MFRLLNKHWPWLFIPIFAAAFVTGMSFRYQQGGYDPPPVNLPAFEEITVLSPPVRGFTEVLPQRQGMLLVDAAHFNNFDEEDLTIPLGRVADRGYTIELLTDDHQLSTKLEEADSFIVILPQVPYTAEDVTLVHEFVDKGGKVLLVADPGRSNDINSLARSFGMVFQPGYLYNVAEHDINFQNIFVKDFLPHDVTQGLEQIALYTAGSIKSSGLPLALTDSNTYSSMIERTEAFSPLARDSSGRVLGLFDLTFMTPPNNAVWDNERLIANLADYLTKSERSLFE